MQEEEKVESKIALRWGRQKAPLLHHRVIVIPADPSIVLSFAVVHVLKPSLLLLLLLPVSYDDKQVVPGPQPPAVSVSVTKPVGARPVMSAHAKEVLSSDDSAISYHRPFLRSALARSLYERMMREEQLRKLDKSEWYACDLNLIRGEDESLADKFVQMDLDEEGNRFVESCYQKSDWFMTHLYHSVARSFLSLFMTSTSINGLLDRGSMFVFSANQFRTLYPEADEMQNESESRLLDLGAGDGKVTHVMAQFFRETFVTEVSPVMKRLLTRSGYSVLPVDQWHEPGLDFDLISCLNLLDRCDKPVTMLRQMLARLKPSGRIILALVLPLSQYVESGRPGRQHDDHRPSELLEVTGDSFEQQLVSLEKNVLSPMGLEILTWTRVPYLCEGDLDLSFYWLHDVVMLLRKRAEKHQTVIQPSA